MFDFDNWTEEAITLANVHFYLSVLIVMRQNFCFKDEFLSE